MLKKMKMLGGALAIAAVGFGGINAALASEEQYEENVPPKTCDGTDHQCCVERANDEFQGMLEFIRTNMSGEEARDARQKAISTHVIELMICNDL